MPTINMNVPPKQYTPEQLSRIQDALTLLRHIDKFSNSGSLGAFWYALPFTLKMEFGYSRWKYTRKKKTR